MKKTLTRIALLVLCVCMVFSCAACSTTKTEYKVDIGSQNVAGDSEAQLALQAQLAGSCEGVTLTILDTYDDTAVHNQCYSQMFQAMCGGKGIEVIKCAEYSGMQQKLASMHMSGEAPDLYVMTNQDYPSIMYRDILVCLSDYIDFGSAVYTDADKELLVNTSFNGGIYFWPTILDKPSFSAMFWNKNIFEQAGIPESEWPDAHVANNTWTWDVFYDLVKRTSNRDNDIYGFVNNNEDCFMYAMAISTGEDFIKVTEDGTMCNFTSPNITRAMNMMKQIRNNEYSLVTEDTSGGRIFARGKAAFNYTGLGASGNTSVQNMAAEGIIGIVPMPRDPQVDEYYVYGSIQGYAVPTGSKNTDAAIKFIQTFRSSNYYRDQLLSIQMNAANWSEDAKAMREDILANQVVIPCASLGMKEILSDSWAAGRKLLSEPTATWETVAAEYAPKIQGTLDKLG